jgi:hypothetical protein
MESKFKIGDKVKVVNYGHLMWVNKKIGGKFNLPIVKETETYVCYDTNKGIVGNSGIVKDVKETQGFFNYSLSGIKGKSAWYTEDQIEIVSKNVNVF